MAIEKLKINHKPKKAWINPQIKNNTTGHELRSDYRGHRNP
jgi:hypothetical protein